MLDRYFRPDHLTSHYRLVFSLNVCSNAGLRMRYQFNSFLLRLLIHSLYSSDSWSKRHSSSSVFWHWELRHCHNWEITRIANFPIPFDACNHMKTMRLHSIRLSVSTTRLSVSLSSWSSHLTPNSKSSNAKSLISSQSESRKEESLENIWPKIKEYLLFVCCVAVVSL